MMRFIRQLLGKGRRELAADEELRQHRIAYERDLTAVKNSNRALKKLVEGLQKDITAWH